MPGTTKPLAVEQVNKVMAEAQARGVLVGKNVSTVKGLECTITLSPPLVITQAEVKTVNAGAGDGAEEVGSRKSEVEAVCSPFAYPGGVSAEGGEAQAREADGDGIGR
ncbi:MAG: hypothetical protein U0232_08090 [Thermomicrobiales bacterium]